MSRWEPILAGKSRTLSTAFAAALLSGIVMSMVYLMASDVKLIPLSRYIGNALIGDLIPDNLLGKKKPKAERPSESATDYGQTLMLAGAVLGLSTVGFFALILSISGSHEKKLQQGEFVSGNREVSVKEAIEEVKAKLKDPQASHDFRHTPQDIKIKPAGSREEFRWPRYAGAGHALFLGASGGGKSNLIHLGLQQIRDAGSKAIILDPGGHYYARFGRRGDRIYSIYDKRAEYYDFWSEPRFDYFALSSSLIEGKNTSGKDEFFTESPQSLFAGLLRLSKDGGMAELKKHIYDPDIEYLQKTLKENTEVSAQFLNDPRLATHVMASYATKLYWLKYLNYWAEQDGRTEPYGISQWARDDSDLGWVFLVAENKDWEASKHFFRMLVTIAGKAVYGRGSYRVRTDIYEIQDEIEAIGYNAEFSNKLNLGRRDGYIMWGGLQATSQFESVYGPTEAKTIIHGFQNRFMFKAADKDMAEIMSDLSGTGRWQIKDEAIANDGRASVNTRVEDRPAFRIDEFNRLRPGECVGVINGINPFKFAIPHKQYPIINPATMSEIPPI